MKDLQGSSEYYYNNIFGNYYDICSQRYLYNETINNILISYFFNVESYLDIGTGDGIRIGNILRRIKTYPKSVVCLEPSDNFFNLLNSQLSKFNSIELLNSSIEQFDSRRIFSHITALWNVLGHVSNVKVCLNKIFSLLQKDGIFIFDVNNRFNISNYGIKNIMNNIYDELTNKSSKGFYKILSDSEFTAFVYIFSPCEIIKLLNGTGFKIIKIFYIDYRSGQIVRNPFQGQMLFVCSK